MALAALLSACTMAPEYEQPTAPVAAAYERRRRSVRSPCRLQKSAGRNSSRIPNCRISSHARCVNNRDLRIATLNVEAARAQYRIQRADLVPAIDAGGTANNQRTPASLTQSGRERAHA